MRKTLAALITVFAVMALLTSSVFAGTTSSLLGQQWRIWNVEPDTSAYWDINKAKAADGGVSFPVQEFQTPTTGSFAVYLMNNYNRSLTPSQTLTASATWTQGTYKTRSTVFSGAYARFWFQDVASGSYTSNDYWWYSGASFDLNGSTTATVSAALSDRAHWSNICGQLATDTVAQPGPNCVGGTDPAVSPYAGFTSAMANVKQLGLSFGSAGSYASGVALDGGTGTFTMTAFDITP